MAGLLKYSVDLYVSHIAMLIVFSFSFIVAFLIPIFAAFPTYNDAGAIFIRLASISQNLTPLSAAVIIFSTLLSLLFLSFAIVSINIVVKHSRTRTRIRREVVDGIEKYTTKVFLLLLLFSVITVGSSTLLYYTGAPAIVPYIVGLLASPFFFYAPAAIVMDEMRASRALRTSARLVFAKLSYPLVWLAVAIVLLSALDLVFIAVGGASWSRYMLLVFNSVFIMPFLVIMQSEAYLRRYPLMKH